MKTKIYRVADHTSGTEELINKFTERYGIDPREWDWDNISLYTKLSENFIREFKDYINWSWISYKQTLSEDFIREFKDKVGWTNVSIHQRLSENLIRECQDKVDWIDISRYQKLSENFIREFKDNVDWGNIGIYQKLSENFIREFKDKVEWGNIGFYQKLSENFIREFKDKVYWNSISAYQKLSEDFIREFQDRVNWYFISKNQDLSADFIREFKDKINMDSFARYNRNCPPEIKIRYMKEHNIIKKQDPETHDFEYEETESSKPKNNSLEELKQLISINLNEKITIAKIDNIMSQSNSLSKPDKNKINRALSSFWKNFDENNIPKTNKELSDLIEVAMFSPVEKRQFLGKIKKELSSKGISLDSLSPMN